MPAMPEKNAPAPCCRHRRWRLPRWFKRALMIWVCAMLLAILAGYCLYIFKGHWTPDHLGNWFRLGFGGV